VTSPLVLALVGEYIDFNVEPRILVYRHNLKEQEDLFITSDTYKLYILPLSAHAGCILIERWLKLPFLTVPRL
jgi:hypothetical protein